MTARKPGQWPGLRTGVASGLLGLLLTGAAYGAQGHAAQGSVASAGEVVEVAGAGPVHVVGVASGGTDGQSARCTTVADGGSSRSVEVGIRRDRSRSIPAGRRLPAGTVSVTCDQRFSASTGAVVLAYPLAGSTALPMAYLAVALVGIALVGHLARARRARPASAVALAAGPPGPGRPGAAAAAGYRAPRLTAAAFGLAVATTLAMLAISVAGSGHRVPELPQNLLLLVVILAVLGTAASLRRPR